MNLTFKFFDGRGWNYRPVIDEDTGKEVGSIRSNGVGPYSSGGIRVSLFDGKYAKTFNRRDECWGFVKGVEAVMNHLTAVEDKSIAEHDNEAA